MWDVLSPRRRGVKNGGGSISFFALLRRHVRGGSGGRPAFGARALRLSSAVVLAPRTCVAAQRVSKTEQIRCRLKGRLRPGLTAPQNAAAQTKSRSPRGAAIHQKGN